MPQIIDVSPTGLNTHATDIGHSVTGRMLCIACSPDGKVLYAGSYSNFWISEDGGRNWEQLSWPQPEPDQFDVPGALGGWCAIDLAVSLGWRVEKHPRFLAQLTRPLRGRKPHLDIVGFGDCGVWTALGNGDGSFQPPNVVIANFGYQAGGWHVDKHPRFAVDLTGDGVADIVGFGDAGVWTALGNGDGTFQEPKFVVANFGYQQAWRVNKHPRFLARLTNSGFADIVGFGDAGVWTALGNGDGTFQEPHYVLANFGVQQSWRVSRHPRLLARLTDSGFADIVGFGDAGVWTALGNGDGTFQDPHYVLDNFGVQQGWRVERHPRLVADLDSDGRDDIVGFGDLGVWTALSDGQGGFSSAQFVLENFGYRQGWRVSEHPRFVAKLTSSGYADIVGFGDAGVWTALGTAGGGFDAANYVLANFGVQQGWRVDRHPRLVGDLNGDGSADIVGFGDAGVWSALGDGHGGFPASNFVQANFGYGTIVLALMAADRATGSRGLWRSTDAGSTWTKVHQFPSRVNLGQLEWALGSDHLVYAAGGSSLAISRNAGQTFQDVFPWGSAPAASVNHVAIWQNSPADPFPAVIYALGTDAQGTGTMFLSFDGGVTWMRDKGALPANIGGPANPTANFNSPKVMVISPHFPLEIFVAQNGSGGPDMVFRGDYSHFPFGDQTSSWDALPLPDALTSTDTQDSGNVFLATTRRGHGDLLFYSAQRWYGDIGKAAAYVGPLDPQSGDDWHRLGVVHVDLHGMLLSPDFRAEISGGTYTPHAGTVWMLSDGGIYRSTDGGTNFDPAKKAQTLSCLSVAGVAMAGKSPALSLNSGDNDGFYSMDGGQNWAYQQYGGGDNDCAYADPLRPNSIMVFTPRWGGGDGTARTGQTVAVYESGAGNLPDASNGNDRRIVTGPPTVVNPQLPGTVWNANSGFGEIGFCPVVLGLPGEEAPAQGDYIFILLNPEVLTSPNQPVLVRTQNILDIASRQEWVTTATGPGQGANVFLQGPALPNAGLGVVQAAGGHANPVFYIGGDGTLWSWTNGAANWNQLVPANAVPGTSVGVTSAIRFFVHPYQPTVIYVLDNSHVKRSDDGGSTWAVDSNLEVQLTWNGQIALSSNDDQIGLGEHFDLVLTGMQFDPNNPLLRIAIGAGGAFMTIDGVNWTRLLHTGALAGRPSSCYYDWASDPFNPVLYVAFAGRSLVKITDLPIEPLV